MRLITSCQPSGVVRLHEIRVRLLLSSLVWHGAHFEITSVSVTGMPSSGAFLGGAGGLAASAGRAPLAALQWLQVRPRGSRAGRTAGGGGGRFVSGVERAIVGLRMAHHGREDQGGRKIAPFRG